MTLCLDSSNGAHNIKKLSLNFLQKKKKKKKQIISGALKMALALMHLWKCFKIQQTRVATVREKYLENEIFSRSGKSQGILWMIREV